MNIYCNNAKRNYSNSLKLIFLFSSCLFISNFSIAQEVADKVFDWKAGFQGWSYSPVEYSQLYDGYNGASVIRDDSHSRNPGEQSIRFYVNSLQNLKALPTCPFERRSYGTLSNGDPCNPAKTFNHFTNQGAELGDGNLLDKTLKIKNDSTLWIGWSEYFEKIDRKRNCFTIQFRSQEHGVPGGPAAGMIINNGKLKLYAPHPNKSQYPTATNSGVEIKEKVWYDYVVEIKYSYSTNGRIRVWRREAKDNSKGFNFTSEPIFEFHGHTMFHPEGYPNPNSKRKIDSRPHLRWGIHRDVQKAWFSCTQNNISQYEILEERCEELSPYIYASIIEEEYGIMTKFLGTARFKVGDIGANGFNAVKPKSLLDEGNENDSGNGGSDNPSESHNENLQNLAPFGNVSQSSAISNGSPVNAIDGDTSDTYMHSNLEETPWWSIDLGSSYYVEAINIWNRIDCCFSETQQCYVFVSNEPLTSNDIELTLENPKVYTFSLNGSSKRKQILPIQTVGRYFRIQISGINYLSLGEVEIMGMIENQREDNIWIEAECGEVGNSWVTIKNQSTSNGEYVYLPNNNNLNYRTPPSEAKLIAKYDFFIQKNGIHSIYFRCQASTPEDDSFWIRIDNDDWIQFNNLKKKSNFLWEELHDSQKGNKIIKLDLEIGNHTIEVGIREDGTKLDKIYITSTELTPSKLGENAANCTNSTKSNISETIDPIQN